ncbi:DUF4129 domain-containing protein [Mucilaginibacter sp. PAMB04274]|uniref:DUF4129 domain-containing protein n=1 Tax=Mucilaginibacter sp. PAMB04274 TaxID=3138568 RepID=UPI0031F63F20
MRFLYLLLLLFIPFATVKAGQPVKLVPIAKTKAKAVLRTDSSVVQVRHFDAAQLARLKQKPDFRYDEEASGPSLWTRFWRWFWHLFTMPKFRPETNILFTVLKYFFIALGIAAIAFIILRLVGVDVTGLFKRKPADASVPYEETLENIHEINFDTDIDKAIAQHNYRLAVRLLYLRSLKQLNDAGLINWQIDKTNAAYIEELTNPEQREAFTVLTRQFEFVWYGEFMINNSAFQNISALFGNFKQTLS